MNKRYKVGFVSVVDINNRDSWSGTLFYTKKHLSKYFDIVDISPLKDNLKLIYYPYKFLLKRVFNKNYIPDKKKIVSKYYAKQVHKILKANEDIDLLFCMGTVPMSYVETNKPMVLYTDSCYKATLDYYNYKTNIIKSNIIESNKVEEKALKRADYLFFSSHWACEYAKSYNINPAKIQELNFGINMDNIPLESNVKNFIDKKCSLNQCNLLFLGRDWERKGGDIAYKTYKYLRYEKRMKVSLTIIGCDKDIQDTGVVVIPYINKNTPKQMKLYEEILRNTHFLLLPTRADCSSMVTIESNAYGIPSLITNTGGIPSILSDGENGFMFNMEDGAEIYGEKIYQLFNDKVIYKNLCTKAREHCINETNWDKTAKVLADKMVEIIENKR